jgi:uncharacterized protein (DUF2249 family)
MEKKMSLTSCGVTIDTHGMTPQVEHAAVYAAFRMLNLGDSIEVRSHRNLQALYEYLREQATSNFAWHCLANGPDTWRVNLKRVGVDHGAGECCGHCGGRPALTAPREPLWRSA